MSRFNALLEELDEWNFAGEDAMFWWRDDDAIASSAALEDLLEQSARYDVPLAVAAIPAHTEPSLADCVADYPLVSIVQHGIAHQNRAAAERKKQELVAGTVRAGLINELSEGFVRLQEFFNGRCEPVLVPPWNRIDAELLPLLGPAGYLGLSCFGARSEAQVDKQLWIVNTHVDLVDWKQAKKFAGHATVLAQLVGHLQNRRTGLADMAEPTGILSHHLVHDADCKAFISELMVLLDEHPAASWLSTDRVFQTTWRQPEIDYQMYGQDQPL